MSLVNDTIQRICADHAEREALVGVDGRTTYGQLGRWANRIGHGIRSLGVTRGDRAAIFMQNCNAWIATELGCLAAGAGVIPTNQRFSPEEVSWVLGNSEAGTLIFSPTELETVETIRAERPDLTYLCMNVAGTPLPDWARDLDAVVSDAPDHPVDERVEDTDLARIMYTSATTGLPKGVVIDHDHWRSHYVHSLLDTFVGVDETDAYLAATPLTHMAGGWTWGTLMRGGKTVILDRWDVASFAKVCEEERITLLMMAPTMFVSLLEHLDQHPGDLEAVERLEFKRIMYGASPMPQAVSARVEEIFGPIMSQLYGFTENIGNGTGMTVTRLTPDRHTEKRHTCGRPQINTAVRVVDTNGQDVAVGELGEVVTKAWRPCGVWKNPEATAEIVRDGWIHSGDIGFFDEDGFLTLADRKNHMIISGGLNIYPQEVENAIHRFEGILECAVVGAAHSYWVETPVAYYVVKEGATVDPEALRQFLRDTISHYKVPRDYIEVAELPKSSYGKILKRILKERYADEHETLDD